MAKTKQEGLFPTVSRGYDKAQVERYLQEMMENHVCQQEQLQEQVTAREQAAANAVNQLVALQQELGESLYDLQVLRRENERLRRENDDAVRKVTLADKMLANSRGEVSAATALKEEMEHSLTEALEKNLRLEKQIEELKNDSGEDGVLLQQLRSEMVALQNRNNELETQLATIRRKIMEAAKARQARRNQQEW
jgi:DNA repair exonuclease SbcCD ATPase subunit